MTIGPDGMDEIEREIAQRPRRKHWLHTGWLLSMYTYAMLARRKMHLAYDHLMTTYWPYERFPQEWRSLWSWRRK